MKPERASVFSRQTQAYRNLLSRRLRGTNQVRALTTIQNNGDPDSVYPSLAAKSSRRRMQYVPTFPIPRERARQSVRNCRVGLVPRVRYHRSNDQLRNQGMAANENATNRVQTQV